jgi:hypothetical protein
LVSSFASAMFPFTPGSVSAGPEPRFPSAAKTKKPTFQIFWHVGFGISFCTEDLGPQQPQARNVVFATATAVAATTHGLASHSHQLKEYVGCLAVSMPSLQAKTPIHTNRYLDAATWLRGTPKRLAKRSCLPS